MATMTIKAADLTEGDHIFPSASPRTTVYRAYETQGVVVLHTTGGVYNYRPEDDITILARGALAWG